MRNLSLIAVVAILSSILFVGCSGKDATEDTTPMKNVGEMDKSKAAGAGQAGAPSGADHTSQ